MFNDCQINRIYNYMQSAPVKIISFNVNGVLNPVKRSKILSKLKREKAQIALLQETHMSQTEHTKLRRMGFKWVFSSSDKSSHKRGVATLISNTLNYEHISETCDGEGRYIRVTGRIEGFDITILNVYAPPGSDWLFYRSIFDLMVDSQGLTVCGGDFNIRLNPKLDSSTISTSSQNNSLIRKVNSYIEELGIADVWRELHPSNRDYTFYSCPNAVYTRIDYFFMFRVDRFMIRDCDILMRDLSDHSPISMSLLVARKRRNTLWKFNSHILNDPATVTRLKEDIKEYLEINDTGEVSPIFVWDTLKAVLRGKIICLTSFLKKMKGQKLVDLQENLKQKLQEDINNPNLSIKQEIRKIQGEINDIYTQEAQKNLIFMKQNYYEIGGKSTKYLAYKLRKQQEESTIYKIKNPRTNVLETKIEKIQECFENFYRELYSCPRGSDENGIDAFLISLDLPTLADPQNDDLIKPISVEEINAAISRLKSGKAVGADGYNSQFYRSLRQQLVPVLHKAFNWILKEGEIPPSWREATISVIPKEGKDRQECGNYRPISVLNLDYKLFTSIFARRLEKLLPTLINLDQTGFIHHRQTTDNIRRTLHILDRIQKDKIQSIIASLDAEKAFDSVSWTFLYKVLRKFGFHDNFVTVIQALYNQPSARIKVNGDLSNSFALERGCRQGCAISPLLFDLFIETLGQLIRQTHTIKGIVVAGVEHKVAMFADDVLVCLGEPERSFNVLMTTLTDFGRLSGYKVNISKTQVMTLNYTASAILQNKFKLNWENEKIKYLGIHITRELSGLFQANYYPLSLKIKADLHRWNLVPFLSLSSRICAIKMNILPRLLYLFRNLPIEVSDNQFREWDKWISRFIWQGQKPRIRYSTLQLAKEKGGLGLPCLKNYYFAAQIVPLLYWLNGTYMAKWKELESNFSNQFPIQAVIADRGLMNRLERLGNPWLNHTLRIWQRVNDNCEIHKVMRRFRWFAYDSDFIPNRGDSSFKSWSKTGLTTFSTLIQKDHVHCFEFLQEKHGLQRGDLHRYFQMRSYIEHECKLTDFSDVESEFHRIVKSAISTTPSNSISRLYTALSLASNNNTIYIKEKWEREAGIELSGDTWTEIWNFQWTTSNSMDWREHCWKNIVRFFRTPYQEKYKGANIPCWRQCGSTVANHHHIFWECPKLSVFWKDVQKSLGSVFNSQIPLNFESLYLGNISFLELRRDIKLMQILLVASKKAITRRWLSPIPPTLEDWFGIVLEIFRLEKLTYLLRTQKEKFYQIWNSWIIFITPMRADFI